MLANTAQNDSQDLISKLGLLALGCRLKRVSDSLFVQVEEVYKKNGVSLKPSLFPCFYLLATEGEKSITEIADTLKVTHPAVCKMVKGLLELTLAKEKVDQKDERRRLIELSSDGIKLVKKLSPIWIKINQTLEDTLKNKAQDLLLSISRIENALSQQSLNQRMNDKQDKAQVQILPYDDSLAYSFYDLNAEWINSFFKMEEHDREMLLDPKNYFIKKGGQVFFAILNGKPVGTCAVLPHKSSQGINFEITKMAVTEKARGFGIGKTLCIQAIDFAKQNGGNMIFLESNRKLTPALSLYRAVGFIEKPQITKSEYERADIYMELKF